MRAALPPANDGAAVPARTSGAQPEKYGDGHVSAGPCWTLPAPRLLVITPFHLRKLIEADPAQPRYLQTVWGFGYVFVPDGATKE